jgi:hypothetical protein
MRHALVRSAVLGSLTVLAISSRLAGQGLSPVWISVATGFAGSNGDTLYRSTLHFLRRLGVGVRLSVRIGLEGSALSAVQVGGGDYACLGRVPCPAAFEYKAAAGSVVVNVGATEDA